MRIAVDAMGGDHGPSVVVAGAIDAARAFGVEIAIVGRKADIDAALSGSDRAGLVIDVLDALDVIEMDESPAMAVRRKPNSSISVALREVKEGRAGAMVSTGNSGAVMAASLGILGRIRGVERPALAGVLPTFRGNTIMVDLGAVTDPTAGQLVQFAHMARVYAEAALGKHNPSIALLSNGEESSKGNQLVQEVFPLLEHDPGLNFIGNAEGADILPGEIDVIVTDGFTGNVALKSMEGTFSVFMEIIREEMTRTLPRKLVAMLMKPTFRAIRNRLDYAEIGGAPLLGVNGVVIIAHGRSDQRAVMNAVGAGKRAADQELPRRIREALATDEQ
ncbi:MAG: phosphate acyltransferase PlsX [Thermomicrobiales bacterium]|nr:phosphate acyltransferase PlsX [Thermomicrobiales bacterium]